jgi:hypothetical protein
LITPLLRFYYKDEVRESAVTIVPALLSAARKHLEKYRTGPQQIHNLWQSILPTFLQALVNEPELSILLMMIDCFQESINLAGPDSMNADQLTEISKAMLLLTKDLFQRRKNRENCKTDPDYDEVDERRMQKTAKRDEVLMRGIGEVIGKTFRHFGMKYLPIFQRHCGDLAKRLLSPTGGLPVDLLVGICIFDDIIEHCKEESAPVIKFVLPSMLHAAALTNPGIRQAAVFGLGMCAQYGGPVFRPHLAEIIALLGKLVSGPESKDPEYKYARDNAISSFGKVLVFWTGAIPPDRVEQFFGSFLSWLPVLADPIECHVTYETLCVLSEKHLNLLVGSDTKRLAHLLRLFSFVYNSKYVAEPTNPRIMHLLRELRSRPDFREAVSSLKPEDRDKLQQILAD